MNYLNEDGEYRHSCELGVLLYLLLLAWVFWNLYLPYHYLHSIYERKWNKLLPIIIGIIFTALGWIWLLDDPNDVSIASTAVAIYIGFGAFFAGVRLLTHWIRGDGNHQASRRASRFASGRTGIYFR
jgi:low temperature requirement protein LtrA